MKTFTKIVRTFLLVLVAQMLNLCVQSQSVLDPSDPIVAYNAATPPVEPPYGQIGKWVRTKRINWNTDAYKAYIYKGSPFRLKFPKTYVHGVSDGKTYPMIIMFHGLGEKGLVTDNDYQLYHGGQVHLNAVNNGTFDGFVLFMQTQGGFWGEGHLEIMSEIIDYMIQNNKLDPFRVNIHGLSAGGQAVWKMVQDYPTYISSALPMSAVSVYYKEADVVNKLKYTPLWLFQGGEDGAPAPATAVQVRDAMVAGGANFTYSEYAGVGHGTWNQAYSEPNFFPFINKAHKANPYALYGRTEFCPGDPININLGVTAGFNAYEWRKDGVIIPGATSNQINVTTVGTYDCRIRRGSLWSPWSPTPVVVKIKEATVSPNIQVAGLSSKVIPALDGSTKVSLQVPTGYTSYLWQREGNGTTLSTTNVLNNAVPGNYKVKVTELYGCSSDFSAPFTVIDANGPNKPDAPINLTISTLSKTSLRLDWSDNPSPAFNETNFEIYESETAGGQYRLIGFTGADVLTYTVEGLNSFTTRYYKVRAINNTAASASSNEANGTTATDTQAPTAPVNLIVAGSTRSSVSLSWEASTDDVEVTQYDIFINNVKSYVTSATNFTVYNLETNKSYNFKVKARDFANNLSPFSNQVTGTALLNGLNYKYYHGSWSSLPDFNALTPVKTGTVAKINLDPRTQDDNIGFLWEGFIIVPVDGSYTFRTNSDDGSKLYLGPINGTTSPYSHTATALVNNDGTHGTQNRDGTITLTAGSYPIAISYFNGNGGRAITVSWRTPLTGTSFITIPDNAFADPIVAEGNAPVAASNLSAVASSYKSIDLSWTDNSNNESGFEIYRSTDPVTGYSTIGIASANSNFYVDSTVASDTRYYYKIRAVNQYGESALASQFIEAQWKFDNNYTDASGNNRQLVPVSGPTFDGVNKTEGSHSVKLNGTSHYFNINTNDGYLKNVYSEKSIAFWMKSNSNVSNKIIVDLGGSDDGLSLRLDNNLLYAGVASNNSRRSFSVPYTSNDWNHVALVYDKKTLTLYLNGVVAASVNDLSFSSLGTTTNLSRIGLHDGSTAFNVTGNRFNGLIDNFTIYGTAIVPDVVLAHMNNSIGASNAKTLPLPVTPPAPANLQATAAGTSSVNINWNFNPTTNDTTVIPAGVLRIEAESYKVMSGVSTQNSSEGGLNVTGIDANDWMDYEVNVPVGGQCTVSFRVATTATNTAQIQLRTSDEILLATLNIPKTASTQTYTTVSTTVTLPAGLQTLRVFAGKNGWTFNWFEIATAGSTVTSSTTANATALQLFRSSNTNLNYLPLALLPGGTTSYTDSSLFANSVYYYKVKALNEGGASAESNEDSATTSNNIPVIAAISNQNMRYGTQLQLNLSATDADPEVLSFQFANLPAFASFTAGENGKGVLTFNPSSASDQNLYSDITVKVFDQKGDSSSISFALLVNDNYVPVISATSGLSLNELTTGVINISATDQNVENTLTWSFEGLPSFATITNNGNAQEINLAPGYADNGIYNVTAKVEDGNGGVDTASFVITVVDISPVKKVYINFNLGNNAPAPWNNTNKNPKPNDNFPGLLDQSGANSGIGLQIVSWLNNGYNVLGATTGNNSGIYPDAVMNGAYFGQTANQTIKIYGLVPSNTYSFTFFGSRGGVSDNRSTNYTISGQTVTLNAAGNTTNTVSLVNLQPLADSTLTLNVKNGTGSSFSYLNAMVIESSFNDGTVPAKARDLKAQFGTEKVSLSWTDAAYNETAYQVYRATAPEGPYTLLNPGGNNANLTTYEDANVLGNTTYYYTVSASNEIGLSPYSDTVEIATPNNSPIISNVGDVNMKINEVVNLEVSATDNAEDVVTLSVSGLPSFATFTNNGNGSGTIHIAPGTAVGTFEGIVITATDDKGASSNKQIKIVVTVTGVSPIYVNFNQVSPVGYPWNSFNIAPAAGSTLSALKDNTGFTTGVGITMVETGWSANNLGATTGSNSGIYPDDVMLTSFYHNANTARTVRISGLNQTKKYTITFFGSRSGNSGENRNTVFTIGGQNVTLNAAGNTNNTVQISNLTANSSGIIEFSVAKGTGSTYAYLNALVIEGYEEGNTAPVVSAPILQAVGKSKTSIGINWMNGAQNQTGVQVFRSSSQNGTYDLLATLAGNATSYLDQALAVNTQYFYYVRGVINAEYTPYSNIATAATLSYMVHVNFNRQTPPAGAPWNNTNNLPQDGSVYENLSNESNNSSGINMSVIGNTWSGENIYGVITGNDSGIYPDNVISSTWWLDRGSVGTLKIDGLNQSMKYSFVFFASRDGGGEYADRTTTYSAGGKSVSLNAINNSGNTVQINDLVPDQDGAVYINIAAGGSSPYGYLGALVIQGYSLPVAVDPATLGEPSVNVNASTVSALESTGSRVLVDAIQSSNKIEISAYPNPFVNDVNLRLSVNQPVNKLSVVVADISGRIIYTQDLRNIPQGVSVQKLQLNGNRMNTGLYFIKVIGLDGEKIQPIRILKGK